MFLGVRSLVTSSLMRANSVRAATELLAASADAGGRADGTAAGTRHGHEQAGLRANTGHGQDALWATSR